MLGLELSEAVVAAAGVHLGGAGLEFADRSLPAVSTLPAARKHRACGSVREPRASCTDYCLTRGSVPSDGNTVFASMCGLQTVKSPHLCRDLSGGVW